MATLKDRLLPYYVRANSISRGSLEVIRISLKSFTQVRGAEAAASLAYYALFSLFPLIIILISVTSFLLRTEEAVEAVVQFILQIIPNAQGLIERNIQVILNRRTTFGTVGLIATLWSASGFFNTLVRNINFAWLHVKPRDVIRTRLLALAMIGILIVLLVLSLTSSAILNIIRLSNPLIYDSVHIQETAAWTYLRLFVPAVFTFLLFLLTYRLIPNTRPPWHACIWGAVWTSIGWELAKYGFGIYLSSGLAQYEILYGSLGTVLALMFYIYISCVIVLLGAHLTATIDHRHQQRKKRKAAASSPGDGK